MRADDGSREAGGEMTARCAICGEPFPPRNHRSVLCGQPECVAERKRSYVRKCRAKKPDQARIAARKYYEANREQILERRTEGRS